MKIRPRLIDSLTATMIPLPPSSEKKPLRLFVCGPTVYDFLHIGNARTYLVFDVFARYLRSIGIHVFYLQNITDVDDKIIIRSDRDHSTPAAVAKKYQKAYFANMKALGVTSVDKYAPATKFISSIVRQVERLIQKGHVYKAADGYYFDLVTFPDYGHLARRTVSQAEDGVSRIDEGVTKRNRGDFCVWKFSKPGEPTWKTPLGAGRPGWHIEDTAISEHFFGPQYDIHGGGVDLKFPHHEAEIAQQESASGKKPFVKIWLHVGSLTVNGKKMSKSSGNFVTINDFLKIHTPETLRFMTLSSHYRSPLDYTEETALAYQQSAKNIADFIYRLEFVEIHSKLKPTKKISGTREETKNLSTRFFSALADDFNTPQALATLFEFMGSLQSQTWNLSPEEALSYRQTFLTLLSVFGLSYKKLKIPLKIRILTKAREKARIDKQFIQSDDLRKQINTLGYNLDDTPLGQFVRPR
ncbi:MAG: cysteine--tRNA ligase [Patescibacteria group bacterium]